MGNRAVIAFGGGNDAPAVYLHWNGGRASVEGFLAAARVLVGSRSTSDYAYARFVQLVGNWFGGTSSVGAGTAASLCVPEDNGTYVVGDDWRIVSRRPPDYDGFREEVDAEKTAAIARDVIVKSYVIFRTGYEHEDRRMHERMADAGFGDLVVSVEAVA